MTARDPGGEGRLGRILPPALTGLLILAIWECAVRFLDVRPYVLPGPSLILTTLWTDGPSLLGSLWVTFKITVAAFVAAVVLGSAIAVLFAQSRLFERCLFPYAVALQVTPVVSIAPLIIVWVRGNTFLALLICAWIVAFFPIIANTTFGLKSADRNLGALFHLYGATRWQRLRYLQVPTALPSFLTGIKISGGLALIGAVVAEFVAGTGGADTGLASRILESSYRVQIPRLFAGLLMLSLTGMLIFFALDRLSRRLLEHWHESALPPEE
jgi:NitT/TauT family transport system permease protein